MKGKNIALVVAGVMTILLAITCFWTGWWLVGVILLLGMGFLLFRLGGSGLGLTQLDLLKKLPGKKSWWVYGLAGVSTLYWVLLLFGVLKWSYIVLNVCAFLSIALLAFSIAGSKDTPAGLQGIMKWLGKLSIIGLLVLILVVRFFPSWVNYLDYSASDPHTSVTSPAQEEQVAPPSPTPEIDRGFSLPPSDTTVLKDSGVILLENGDYMVVFSFLGNPQNGDVTYQSILFTFPDGSTQRVNARGKETHHLNWTNGGKVEIVFFPDSEDKTSGHYTYLKNKGEQAELPYLLKVGK